MCCVKIVDSTSWSISFSGFLSDMKKQMPGESPNKKSESNCFKYLYSIKFKTDLMHVVCMHYNTAMRLALLPTYLATNFLM